MNQIIRHLAIISALASAACAQSDPSNFDTVYNLPNDHGLIPKQLVSDTQLNTFDGTYEPSYKWFGPGTNIEVNHYAGTIGSGTYAKSGCTLNLLGGGFERLFRLDDGSTMYMHAGKIGGFYNGQDKSLSTLPGSTAHIYGGTVAEVGFYADSDVSIYGDSFKLNGAPISAQPVTTNGDVITAELSDGSPLIFFIGSSEDQIDPGVLTLNQATPPPPDLSPIIAESDEQIPQGVRSGQTLILRENATAPNDFRAINSTIYLEGGQISNNCRIASGTLIMRSGTAGWTDLLLDSYAELHTGARAINIRAHQDSVFNVYGGTLDGGNTALRNGTINVYDATSNYNIQSIEQGNLNLFGGQFNNVLVDQQGTLTVHDGATIHGDLRTKDASTVEIFGGQIDHAFFESDSHITMHQGSIGDDATLDSGATLSLLGGSIGKNLIVDQFGVLTIDGGTVEPGLTIDYNGTAVLFTGQIQSPFTVLEGGSLIRSGGMISKPTVARAGASIELVGSHFEIDGVPFHRLGHTNTYIIHDRDVELNGTLVDGSTFTLYLGMIETFGQDHAHPDATISIRFVDPPCVPDLNDDGILDLGDIQVFIALFLAQDIAADLNADGFLDIGDITEFVNLFLAGC